MWQRRARSRCRCGRGEPQSRCRCGRSIVCCEPHRPIRCAPLRCKHSTLSMAAASLCTLRWASRWLRRMNGVCALPMLMAHLLARRLALRACARARVCSWLDAGVRPYLPVARRDPRGKGRVVLILRRARVLLCRAWHDDQEVRGAQARQAVPRGARQVSDRQGPDPV
jgi:hypothetical protein